MDADDSNSSQEGTTESERILVRLCRSSFLTPWSFANPFVNEGRGSGEGQGKELTDVLVVFGDDILLFSDKNPTFHIGAPIGVAWARWFRNAIWKSALQLKGAKGSIDRDPFIIYADALCKRLISAIIPKKETRRYHLIAVTRGSNDACRHYFQSKRGTYMISSGLRGCDQHLHAPFRIGHIFERGPFVHVFDEFSLEFVLSHFDTAVDFISYLKERESLFCDGSIGFTAAGEEELASGYLLNRAYGRTGFLPTTEGEKPPEFVIFSEGLFEELTEKPEYVAKRTADEFSRGFDKLIEHFAENGAVAELEVTKSGTIVGHEEALRVLASEDRFRRRQLFTAMLDLVEVTGCESHRGLMRVVYSEQCSDRAYVLGAVSRNNEESDQAYRARRQRMLLEYCACLPLRFPKAMTIVAICIDKANSPGPKYEDLVIYLPPPLTPSSWVELELLRKSLGILSNTADARSITATEYPHGS